MKYKLTITLKEFFEKTPEEIYNLNEAGWYGDSAAYNVDVNGNKTFVCLVPPKKQIKLLWANEGSTSISHHFYKTYKDLLEVCKKILKGKKFCCRCGKEITDKAQHYYAGIYHDKCWTSEDQKSRERNYSGWD